MLLLILCAVLSPGLASAQPSTGPICGGDIAVAGEKTHELFDDARHSVEAEPFYLYLRQHAGEPVSCTGSQQPDGGYAVTYMFPGDALLDAVTAVAGGATTRTLLMRGLVEKDARKLLQDMAGASSDLDWGHPIAADADPSTNRLLLKGWKETVFSADTDCHTQAALIRGGQGIVGLTYSIAC